MNNADIDDLRCLKRDVGFQSRYSLMSRDYIPLIERVKALEAFNALLLDYLGVKVQDQQTVLVKK